MDSLHAPTLECLLRDFLGPEMAQALLQQVLVAPALLAGHERRASRAVLSQALNMILCADLLARVPLARERVAEVVRAGGRLRFDHGALRTVVCPAMRLASGFRAFARILIPLGFQISGTYPLTRSHMIGRAFTHQDHPQDIAQFFVSELMPGSFSLEFQQAAERVVGESRDPLSAAAQLSLARLRHEHALPYEEGLQLLRALLPCFGRQHGMPALADYQILLRESAEMAWIATEGNTFNHITERVENIETVAEAQRALGRPMKPAIEVSGSGRVRQTAYFAATVQRQFATPQGLTALPVPGSFYEFIERAVMPGESGLDLSFDSANAQGILKMTAAA